ncbi:DNA polymerase III subunit beta [Methylophilus aquaticus]|uniref:Beta sliding clamp n=1 Tax=Methylophilus aquaticus TaxID=1971610 RepID=A0ABT9JQ30_9PROT|nr:DNA polymerase III subunit beta [Methylophilus aquaticus]MDP8566246.1 DNA polymerase III subunit beta [Methylophilus aquaticus]
MQIKINREVLLKPLNNVTGIVERRHTLPILSNLLVNIKQQEMHLTATDLEMQISLKVPTDIEGELSTTISAKKLLDICRSLPDGTSIEMVSQDNRITLKAGKSRFNLQTLPAADYPLMSKASGQNISFTISQAELKRLLKQVEFAMAQQDIRYYLNGLLMEVNGDQLHVVGTDGHRLSYTNTTLDQTFEKNEVILPRKTVLELTKLLDEQSESPVVIDLLNGQVSFEFGDIQLISKVIDGKFPDYNRVIPSGHQNTFEVNRQAILSALQRASILSNEKYRSIRMVITNGQLKLISTNTEQEEAEEELEILYDKTPLDIGFNVTYLIDVLNNLGDEQITFAFADANSSCLITAGSDANYKYVVMPMRI